MSSLLTNRGVDPARLEIIRNLPDPSMFFRTDERPAIRDNFTLVYTGTVSPRHQLEFVLEALSALRDEMPDLRFLIVGDGPDIDRLKNLASVYKVEKNVVFQEAVPVDMVAGILRNCDAAIASYSDDENGNLVFPTKAFEALEVGIPVICSKVNTVQQYLDSNTVFYFLPGDVNSIISQIRLIRQNPDLVMEKLNFSREFLSDAVPITVAMQSKSRDCRTGLVR
jgi:glycosyltransferase involved in cell wall biosynthesis